MQFVMDLKGFLFSVFSDEHCLCLAGIGSILVATILVRTFHRQSFPLHTGIPALDILIHPVEFIAVFLIQTGMAGRNIDIFPSHDRGNALCIV